MVTASLFKILFLSLGQPVPTPVAMVLDTKGTITLTRNQGKAKPLAKMDLLLPGDVLKAGADGTATVFVLKDGHRESLKPGTKATVEADGCVPAQNVERLKGSKLAEANLTNLRDLAVSSKGAVGVVRGAPPQQPQLVTPLYGATILTDRPMLTWKEHPSAQSYQVVLLSGSEGPNEQILWRADTKEPRLPFPDKQKTLTFGFKFRWKVIAKLPGNQEDTVVTSKFFVITEAEKKDLALLEPLQKSEAAEDMLLAALSYEAHGVYGEALRLYERLAALAPDEASLQRTLADYYERAGLADKAKAAQKKAMNIRK